jgi:hypothetical protein
VALTVYDSNNTPLAFALDDNAAENLARLHTLRAGTVDRSLLHGFYANTAITVAHFPTIYYFVLPMSMGDCFAEMGDFDLALREYTSVLPYPDLNAEVEIPKLWMRLADLHLRWGDWHYRHARNQDERNVAKEKYAQLLPAPNAGDEASLLYIDPNLHPMRDRVKVILESDDVMALVENPAVVSRVQMARSRILQIENEFNFFGMDDQFVPPFSFEFLQTTARYFAQQAAQVEQQYIHFKSQAENEEFRREQMDQQAEIARQSVELEDRNIAETDAGLRAAEASVQYAEQQHANAVAAQAHFEDVRWDLLVLSELEAWASASAVEHDEQVTLDVPSLGYDAYYTVGSQRRNKVLQELAKGRTRISHDLEAGRLERETLTAEAYKGVAEAQRNQAAARGEVARQRKVVAQLQQRYAEENRDFLDLQEFSARLWYELARESRRLARRYLDMAIESGFLAERAYFAETGRDLRLIKFDYELRQTNGLLAGTRLLQDIDSFTLDHVRTRAKKAQLKQTISLADSVPMAFSQLKETGRAFFATTLAQFDRAYPGYYLHKVHNVELVFIGLSSLTGVHGTLRNIGVSTFRDVDGSEKTIAYPADVMPLSQYELRQDALAFRFDPNDLRLFENNGVATMWQIDLPMATNDLDYGSLLDLQLVLYYDAFFSPELEASVLATLPTTGAGSRGISMRLYFPDELFFLRSQGSAQFVVDRDMFPSNQVKLMRTRLVLRGTGDSSTFAGLTLRLESEEAGETLRVTLDDEGLADSTTPDSPLATLVGRPVFDRWTVTIDPNDNPTLVDDGELVLSGLRDLSAFLEYTFDYRQ